VKIAKSAYIIPGSKAGIIRENLKYGFPCDNSIIRVDKLQIGGRRLGKSVIVKDNLVFGIKERRERFIENKGGEEKLLSREGRQNKDVRCEMWIQFENGTRVLVEM